MKNLIIIIVSFLNAGLLFGQETFKETKYFTKEVEYLPGEKLQITGERTFIYITEWDKSSIEAKVEVVSRYNNKVQAEKDLEKIKVRLEKKGETLYYSNALSISSPKEKPKSNLKTILYLSVPSYTVATIKNVYGELSIEGSVEEVTSNSQFSSTDISGCSGKLILNSKYGKLRLEDSMGSINITGNRTDLALVRVGGELDAELQYGKLDIQMSAAPVKYDISVEYSPVTMILPETMTNALDIDCRDCNINIDNCSIILDEKISDGRHRVTIKEEKAIGEVKLKSEQEDVTIITTTTNSN